MEPIMARKQAANIPIYVQPEIRQDVEDGLDDLVRRFDLKSRSELIRMIAQGELDVVIPKRQKVKPEPPTLPGDPDLLAAMRRHRQTE